MMDRAQTKDACYVVTAAARNDGHVCTTTRSIRKHHSVNDFVHRSIASNSDDMPSTIHQCPPCKLDGMSLKVRVLEAVLPTHLLQAVAQRLGCGCPLPLPTVSDDNC